MNVLPIAKVLRVKNVHLSELQMMEHPGDAERYLKEKNFAITEQDSDEFFVTYSNDKYTNTNRNTLVFLNGQGYVTDVRFTMGVPD